MKKLTLNLSKTHLSCIPETSLSAVLLVKIFIGLFSGIQFFTSSAFGISNQGRYQLISKYSLFMQSMISEAKIKFPGY